ncbi:Shikimate kinase 1 [uncultured Eubacterium sp.]|uniref:shikimate kinase n=1 Tax=Brotomerdimonas butyrica TaxID=2981721 RepID=UPI0008220716|nr:shikimate kinase [Brotomerdimonas butyrica]MCU6755860.1 shikimate kinase [Brotomerdimonas butyrica]SCH53250.1 Shikimate kinase 1 [uncultured Eubacterium sp.]
MKNIILIGMPACGKSVTGVILAKSLKMNFIDADLLIQERAGKSLQDIINADGIETFKSIEEEVLNAINVKNTVIATGGSAVYYDSAMRHLKENGVVVYIEASLATIKKRLKNIRTRGVAMEKGQTIDGLYEMRVPLYEKYADCTVRSHRYRAENTVEDIISGLEKIKI